MSASSRPSGTVTFLFTDVEGSTRRWERDPQEMHAAHALHEAIMRRAIEEHGGYAYKMVGDAFQAAFPSASQALEAALQAQCALQREEWGEGGELRVRMALHTGVTEERHDDYFGPALNRAHRLMSAAHGGQVLVSQATRQLLRDNLPTGVSLRDMGEHRLKDLTLGERIFQLVAPDLPSDFPPLKTLEGSPNNLPVQPNPLIGRETEVDEVKGRLLKDDTRLLTLTGVGGIGKTRLALQVGADLLSEAQGSGSFSNGVFFVNLAPLVDPGLVVPTIAYTLGVREAGAQPIAETLKEYLMDKRLLLILDNFEQVLGAAPQVADLLKTALGLKVLVTSRAALNLSMERQYAVPPLPVPDPRKLSTPEALSQYDAVILFIQRAEAVKASFEVNNQNAPAVAEICYRLEGIPLAIELAAARVKVLSPQAMLSRLESRLKLLTGGARDAHTRQQTLRNTIEWSYDLLSDEEKRLFRRASVFRGGRTLEAIEEVCAGGVRGWGLGISSTDELTPNPQSLTPLQIDVLDGVTSLVDKSLMYAVERARGETRYWMLETIYEYANEKLDESGEGEETRWQHALYFMWLAERAEPELTGIQQAEWLARLEDEHDNIRAALHWARESAKGDSHAEAAEAGLRLAGSVWRFWYVRGYFSEGREWLAGLLGLAQEGGPSQAQPMLRAYRAKALHGAGTLAWAQGEYVAARSLYEESLALRRELGDKLGIAASLNNLALVAQQQGDYDTARSLLEESLALRRELGDKLGIALSLGNLGNVAQQQGDYDTARSLDEESLALLRELGDKLGIASSLGNLGNVAQLQGDYDTARAMYEESLALRRELGAKWGIAISLNNLGTLAQLQGDYDTARAMYEESLAMRRELGDKWGIANSLNSLGIVAQQQGDYDTARHLHEESLALRRELGDKLGITNSLAGLGELGVGTGEAERGVRVLAAVEALLEEIGAVLDRADRLPYERAVARAREQLGEEAFKRAWEEGRAMSMEEVIACASETS
jgi:predicted ATPase/class 3 adenylate cyclase/Tfp pilus assembly protein PilF